MANETTISLIKQANKSNKTKKQKQNKKQKTKNKNKTKTKTKKNNNKSQIHGGDILRTVEPPKDSRGCVANTTSRPDDAGPGMQVKLSKSPRM